MILLGTLPDPLLTCDKGLFSQKITEHFLSVCRPLLKSCNRNIAVLNVQPIMLSNPAVGLESGLIGKKKY